MGCSEERIILICEECGERLVLTGPEDDWRSRRAVFKCECGERVTLAGCADREDLGAVGVTLGLRIGGRDAHR